jgi:hypothetical protein
VLTHIPGNFLVDLTILGAFCAIDSLTHPGKFLMQVLFIEIRINYDADPSFKG